MNDLMLSLYVQQGGIKLSAGAMSVTWVYTLCVLRQHSAVSG